MHCCMQCSLKNNVVRVPNVGLSLSMAATRPTVVFTARRLRTLVIYRRRVSVRLSVT